MAAPAEETVFNTSDDASIALLRYLRAGATAHFVHQIDVCSAAPEDLVADLAPAPGTDLAEDGYNSVWYFYCPKRFKNAQGKPSGHRQRAIAGGDTCWHSEISPRPVKGQDGATFCNLSFGLKEGSSRSFNRMGWCMTEYDDTNYGGGDHVLCKVHRSSSSLAKGKLKPTTTTQQRSSSKRKATGDHPQAPPSKMSSLCASVDQVDHQVQPPLLSAYQMMTECSDYVPVDYESLFAAEEDQQLQQNTMFPAAEEGQLLQNTMFPAMEDQQLQQNAMFPPAEEQQLQQSTMFPAMEDQQLQQNAMFPAAEEQQLQQSTLVPAVDEQQFGENTMFSMDEFDNLFNDGCLPDTDSLLNMDEPSGLPEYCGYGASLPGNMYTMDDLFSGSTGCCGTPKAMAPPEPVFFEGLAF